MPGSSNGGGIVPKHRPSPWLCLEVEQGKKATSRYEFHQDSILIGTVAGCDLRLGETGLPPLLCLIQRGETGVGLRKLSPVISMNVGDTPQNESTLRPGDRLSFGKTMVRLQFDSATFSSRENDNSQFNIKLNELQTQREDLNSARRAWDEDANRQSEMLAQRTKQILAREQKLANDFAGLEQARFDLEHERTALEADRRAVHHERNLIGQQNIDLAAKEESLQRKRTELHVHYCKRRDDLAGKTAAVERAAKNIQTEKRQIDREKQELEAAREELARLDRVRKEIEKKSTDVDSSSRRLHGLEQEIAVRQDEIQAREQSVAKLEQDVDGLRVQLSEKFQERRRQLAIQKAGVTQAAQKVQDQKRELAKEAERLEQGKQDLTRQRAELKEEHEKLDQVRENVNQQHKLVEQWQKELELEQEAKHVAQRQEVLRIEQDRQELESAKRQHQEDLSRLERFHAELQERDKRLEQRASQLAEENDQLQSKAELLAENAKALSVQQNELVQQAELMENESQGLDQRKQDADKQKSRMDSQQAALATLRGRLERQQQDLHERDKVLTAQRVSLDEMEAALKDSSQRIRDQQVELREEKNRWLAEKQETDARCRNLESALLKMKDVQESFKQMELELQMQQAALETEQQNIGKSKEVTQARAERIVTVRRRLGIQRKGLKLREAELLSSEQAVETMQEQLRRRAELLAQRERELNEREQTAVSTTENLENRRAEWEQREKSLQELVALRQTELDQKSTEIVDKEQRLEEIKKSLAAESEQSGLLAAQLETERKELQAQRDALAVQQTEISELRETLPAQIARAGDAVARLERAREILREHLNEVHVYTKECRRELEASQQEQVNQFEQLNEQNRRFTHEKNTHLETVSEFRRHITEWHGKVAELQRSSQEEESRIQQKQTELTAQEKEIESTTEVLAEKAEKLQDQELEVARQSSELSRHLEDMQHWYRRKLKDLVDKRLATSSSIRLAAGTASDEDGFSDDNKFLAEQLINLGVADADTIEALQGEAATKSHSLRDVILSGEFLTHYQMEHLEAGRLEDLIIGPLRIIDLVRETPLEAVYRVYDPRAGADALFRQLSAETTDQRRAEFRHRFRTMSGFSHRNVAATSEVLDLENGPGVIQEWVMGLPGNEWNSQWMGPAAWLRVMCQIADGLRAAHAKGIPHGHFHVGRVLATEDGEIKICGIGEPTWLMTDLPVVGPDNHQDIFARDLLAVGRAARKWLSPAARARLGREQPDAWQEVLQRLLSTDQSVRFSSAAAFEEAVNNAYGELPTEAAQESWQHFVQSIREQLQPDTEKSEDVRRSA